MLTKEEQQIILYRDYDIPISSKQIEQMIESDLDFGEYTYPDYIDIVYSRGKLGHFDIFSDMIKRLSDKTWYGILEYINESLVHSVYSNTRSLENDFLTKLIDFVPISRLNDSVVKYLYRIAKNTELTRPMIRHMIEYTSKGLITINPEILLVMKTREHKFVIDHTNDPTTIINLLCNGETKDLIRAKYTNSELSTIIRTHGQIKKNLLVIIMEELATEELLSYVRMMYDSGKINFLVLEPYYYPETYDITQKFINNHHEFGEVLSDNYLKVKVKIFELPYDGILHSASISSYNSLIKFSSGIKIHDTVFRKILSTCDHGIALLANKQSTVIQYLTILRTITSIPYDTGSGELFQLFEWFFHEILEHHTYEIGIILDNTRYNNSLISWLSLDNQIKLSATFPNMKLLVDL